MTEGKVTISADLWNIILSDRSKDYIFKKYLKTYTIVLLCFIAGVLSVYPFTKNDNLITFTYWFYGFWLISLVYKILRHHFKISTIKDEFSFYVKLDELGVTISEEHIPWEHYKFYIEHKSYLEIYDVNQKVSFLPKSNNLNEIINYTKRHIAKKS